jgi:beta-carotene hydroxylase
MLAAVAPASGEQGVTDVSGAVTEHIPGIIGRQSARSALRLPSELDETARRMSRPNGYAFSAWTIFHLALWAMGISAVFYFRGHPWVQSFASVFLGSQLHTLTILQHDCGHRAAYRSPRANLWVGRFLAWFIYMPFTTFTALHRWHHGFLGDQRRDPDEWFYARGPRWLFLRECLFMPRFIVLSLRRDLGPEVLRRVWKELAFNTIAYLLLISALLSWDTMDVLAFGFLLPLCLLAVVYSPISRGYEHYPLACMSRDDPRREDLRFNTITVTNRVLGFFWANITYHVEHHMYPRVPFYRLPALHSLLVDKRYRSAAYPLAQLTQYQSAFCQQSEVRRSDINEVTDDRVSRGK